jgi:hypothetical protein
MLKVSVEFGEWGIINKICAEAYVWFMVSGTFLRFGLRSRAL